MKLIVFDLSLPLLRKWNLMKVKVKVDETDCIWPIITLIEKVKVDESKSKQIVFDLSIPLLRKLMKVDVEVDKTDCIWPIMALIGKVKVDKSERGSWWKSK